MIYYAVIYMKDGNIHLFRSESKEGAEEAIEKVMEGKWNGEIESTKIITKSTETALWKNTQGHWIGA